MLHRTFGKKLNRDVKERKALYRSLVMGLIRHGSIETTIAKAKAIDRLVEKLVTMAKKGSASSFAQVSSFFFSKEPAVRLVKVIAPVMKDKNGGYIRIRRTGIRKGDGTQTVKMEWSIPVVEPEKEKKETKVKKARAVKKPVGKKEGKK